ncbi:hypothetical protein D3C80_1552650 [compost metagenome]
MAIEQLTGQAAGAHGFDGVVATGGVRQEGVAIRRQHFEQVRLALDLAKVGAAHGEGDDLGTRGFDGQAGFFHVTVLAGTDQQTRLVSTTGQDERLVAANDAHGKSSVGVRYLQNSVATRPRLLAAADGVHHFDVVAVVQRGVCMLTARDDIQIEFDRHPASGQVQTGQQGRNGFTVGQFKGFAVQLNAHAGCRHHF